MTLNRHDVIEWLAWPQCQTKIQRIRLCTLRPILYKLAVAFQKRKKGGRSINELIFYSLCAAIKVPSKMNVDQALRSVVAKTTCFFSFLELVRDRKGPSNLVYFILSISSKKNQTKKPFLLFHLLLTFSLTLYSKNPKKNDDHHHSTWLFQAPKRNAIFLLLNIIVFFACVCVYVLDKTRRWKGRNEMAHPKTRSAYCCSIDLGPGGCRPQHHHGLSDRCGCSAIAATFDWYSHTHTAHTSFLHTHTPNCGSGGWGGRKQSSPIKSSFNHLLKQVNILLSFS